MRLFFLPRRNPGSKTRSLMHLSSSGMAYPSMGLIGFMRYTSTPILLPLRLEESLGGRVITLQPY